MGTISLPEREAMALWEQSKRGELPVAYLGQPVIITGHPVKGTHSSMRLEIVPADPAKRKGGSNAGG